MAFGTMVGTMAFVLGQKRSWYEHRDLFLWYGRMASAPRVPPRLVFCSSTFTCGP